ncbi:MAG: class I SAM-dependent methyltransferase [Candidatus Promineifilaceae bacterium]|nr:class I SAM-dependent methyltransferase [Candidatus Promineifilaceae bacterium]
MVHTNRYRGLLRYVSAHWPRYLLGLGGGIVFTMLLIVISFNRGWYSFFLLGLAALLVLLYLVGASLWAAHRLNDHDLISQVLFSVGELEPASEIVYISLGSGRLAISLSRRLTTGHLIVLDVYNPQLAPSRPLARQRQRAQQRNHDPRLSWRDGQFNLLPLPDNSTQYVILPRVLTELWQEGDRSRMMREIQRILEPTGSLLMIEPIRTVTSILTFVPGWSRLEPAGYWRQMVSATGFKIVTEGVMYDQLWCGRLQPIVQPQGVRPAPS